MLQTVAQRLLLLRTKTGLLGGKINDLKWKRGGRRERSMWWWREIDHLGESRKEEEETLFSLIVFCPHL